MEMFFSPFIVPVAAVLAGAVIVVFRGPVGHALGRRIGGEAGPVGDLAALRAELDATNDRVAELEERLDFTERLLSKERDRHRLQG